MANWDITTAGSAFEFETTLMAHPTKPYVIDTNHFFVSYQGAASDGFASVFAVNTSTWAVTEAGTLEHDTQNQTWSSCVQIDTNHFAVWYLGSTTTTDAYVQTFAVNTSTWAITTSAARFLFDTDVGSHNDALWIEGTHYINFWTSASSDGFAQTFDINASTYVVTTSSAQFEFDTQNHTYGATAKIDTNHFIHFWLGGATTTDGTVQVFAVDTSTWAVSTAAALLRFDTDVGSWNACYKIDANHFINFWTGASGDGFTQVFTVNTSTWAVTTAAAQLEFDTQNHQTNSKYSVARLDDNHFLYVWAGPDTGASTNYDGFAQVFEVNTSTWVVTTAGAPFEFDTTEGEYNAISEIIAETTNKLLHIFVGSGNDGYAEVLSVEIPRSVNVSESITLSESTDLLVPISLNVRVSNSADIYAATSDAEFTRSESTWDSVHNAATSTGGYSATGDNTVQSQYDGSSTYSLGRYLANFDTSGISLNGNVIDSVIFNVRGSWQNGGVNLYIIPHTSNDLSNSSSYSSIDFTDCCSPFTLTQNVWSNITLNNNGIGNINLGGTTKFAIVTDDDFEDSTPTLSSYNSAFNSGDSANPPYITVNYFAYELVVISESVNIAITSDFEKSISVNDSITLTENKSVSISSSQVSVSETITLTEDKNGLIAIAASSFENISVTEDKSALIALLINVLGSATNTNWYDATATSSSVSMTDPDNGWTDNGAYAVFNALNDAVTYRIEADFGIPTNAVISGVEIKLNIKYTGAGLNREAGVKFTKNGGTNWSSQKTAEISDTTDYDETFGSSSDIWGRTWTPADFNNNVNLLVNISLNSFSVTSIDLDAVSMRVYYQTAGEGITLSESAGASVVTPPLDDNNASSFESISISESYSVAINNLSITASDSISISENKNSLVSDLLLSVFDSVTYNEFSILNISTILINVYENISLVDSSIITFVIQLSTSENVSITENYEVQSSTLQINSSESISISESKNAQIDILQILKEENIILSEANINSISTLLINSSENISVTENKQLSINELTISKSEGITISEQVVSFEQSFLSVFDSIAIEEFCDVYIIEVSANEVNTTENISISEQKQLLLTSFLSVSESISITENKSISIIDVLPIELQVFENISTTENIYQNISTLSINSSESISVNENIQRYCSIEFTVFENISLTENNKFELLCFIAHLENISVSEQNTIEIQSFILVQENVSITENKNCSISDESISKEEIISINDSSSVYLENESFYQVFVFENVSLSENIETYENVTTSVNDQVSISENIETASGNINIIVDEQISINESSECFIYYALFVSDTIALSESKTLNYPRYWVADGGNWNDTAHWSAQSGGTSGASVPDANALVYFDENSFDNISQTVTINATGYCKILDFSNVTNSPTIAGSFNLNLYGDLTLSSETTFTHTGQFRFNSDAVLTTNNSSTCPKIQILNSSTVDLVGDYTEDYSTTAIQVSLGRFNANGYTISAYSIDLGASGTRVLDLTDSTVYITGTGGTTILFANSFPTNVSIITTNSNLVFTQPVLTNSFRPGGATFNAVEIYGSLKINSNSGTFGNFTLASGANTLSLDKNYTYTFTGDVNLSGTAGYNNSLVSSVTDSQATISKSSGIVVADYLNIKDSNATGGATWIADIHSVNDGNNSGWIWTLQPSVSENISVTDTPEVFEGVISFYEVSVNEEIALTDSATILIENYCVNVYEEILLTEEINATLAYNVSSVEQVYITDYPHHYRDTIYVYENINLHMYEGSMPSFIDVSDQVNTSESISVENSNCFVFASEEISLSENIAFYNNINLFVYENISITESISFNISLEIFAQETVNINEYKNVEIIIYTVNSESITLIENIETNIGNLSIFSLENINILDSLITNLDNIAIYSFDSININESNDSQLNDLIVSVFELITITENYSNFLNLEFFVLDNITVEENILINVQELLSEITTSENISVIDTPLALIQIPNVPQIVVSDSISISENSIVEVDIYGILVSEEIIVSEDPRIAYVWYISKAETVVLTESLDILWNETRSLSTYDYVVSADYRQNLITNPSFEVNSYWGTYAGISTDYALYSTHSGKCSATFVSGVRGANSYLNTSSPFIPIPGKKYTLSANVYIPVGSPITGGLWMGIRNYVNYGGLASTTIPINPGTWTRVSCSYTAQPGQSWRFTIADPNAAGFTGTVYYYVDGVQLEIADDLTDYIDGAQENCQWDGAENASTSSTSYGIALNIDISINIFEEILLEDNVLMFEDVPSFVEAITQDSIDIVDYANISLGNQINVSEIINIDEFTLEEFPILVITLDNLEVSEQIIVDIPTLVNISEEISVEEIVNVGRSLFLITFETITITEYTKRVTLAHPSIPGVYHGTKLGKRIYDTDDKNQMWNKEVIITSINTPIAKPIATLITPKISTPGKSKIFGVKLVENE